MRFGPGLIPIYLSCVLLKEVTNTRPMSSQMKAPPGERVGLLYFISLRHPGAS